MLVWGNSGVGKTTLAATGPGHKAWILFDPRGVSSIAHRTDYSVLDLTTASPRSIVDEFNQAADPFGIHVFLNQLPQGERTVVVDSATMLAEASLVYAAAIQKNSTFFIPGRHGYGTRNQVVRRVVSVMMQACSAANAHLVVITHQGSPTQEEGGPITSISMSLSDALANDVALRFSEVWHMQDSGGARMIYVRKHGYYEPMKSRMFDSRARTSFVWKYDADELVGEGLATWHERWQANGGRKIPLPT